MRYKIIAAMLTAVMLISGCSGKSTTDNTVVVEDVSNVNYSILGENEEDYLASLGLMLELIYAPKGKISRDVIVKYANKYMKEEVAERFIGYGKVGSDGVKTKITFIDSNIAYGVHQVDGITRAIISFSLESSVYTGKITVEMRVDNSGMIYDVIVF